MLLCGEHRSVRSRLCPQLRARVPGDNRGSMSLKEGGDDPRGLAGPGVPLNAHLLVLQLHSY